MPTLPKIWFTKSLAWQILIANQSDPLCRKEVGTTGVVFRDDAGSFVAGRAQWYRHGLDALRMEAMAVGDGLALASNRGIQKLQLETDSQECEAVGIRDGPAFADWSNYERDSGT